MAVDAVHHLAGVVGPRHATSPAYRRSAAWVAGRLRELGYTVRRQRFTVPGGDSWGVPVGAGTSLNLVARAHGVDPDMPHLVVGAHLDTVPGSPGAEDNGSGVGVLLAVAEALQARRSRLPVVLLAFGAEEPRGPTDADHHYGSRAYVASLGADQRRAVRGMVSLDRVGVGDALGRVPVCSALDPPGQDPAQARVLHAAARAGVPATACRNRSSDHWSFVRDGLPGVRIGSTPYAEYHAAGDLPRVVDRTQLARVGRVVLAWLAGGR
ncbi:M28 family metallopeptidase [Nocardioides sp. GCM10027113]|uniref:M28 family metallopeptidase n=1 Tax=unclassified Nocardioides TaxID=2615069 RepID=UPI00361D2140